MGLPQYSSRGLWVNENGFQMGQRGLSPPRRRRSRNVPIKKGRGGEDRGRRFPVKGNVREGGPGLG